MVFIVLRSKECRTYLEKQGGNLNTHETTEEAINKLQEDAFAYGRKRLDDIKRKRFNGNFKISEKQFVEELASLWLFGNLSAAEILLRKIDMDETATRSDMQAELHLFILKCIKFIKGQMPNAKFNIELEDLIEGKYSTDRYLKSQPNNQIV
jgi:DNA polymerase III delta prime subunit